MVKESVFIGALCLIVAACGSVHQQPQKVEAPRGQTVTLMAEPEATELKAEVGGTILKVDKVSDAAGGNHASRTRELKYLGLTPDGHLKLRIVSDDSSAGPVDFEQDPGAVYTLENMKVEFIEAQPSWVRYKISPAGGRP